MSNASSKSASRDTIGVGAFDTVNSYGWVSLVFHLGMEFLFLVQLGSSAARYLFEDSALEQALWPSHSQIGLMLLFLVVLRGLWGLANAGRRPGHDFGVWGPAAQGAHLALYALMVLVPLLAVLRSYGSGRGIDFLGLTLVERTGVTTVAWMGKAGDALHSELGWIFFAVVLVHTVAALFHRHIFGTAVLHRMGLGTATARRHGR